MTEISFSNMVIVAAVAFAAPLVLELIPRLRLPAVVFEIVLGIAVGLSGLGWVISDLPSRFWRSWGWRSCCSWPAWTSNSDGYGVGCSDWPDWGSYSRSALPYRQATLSMRRGRFARPFFIGIVLSATSLGLVAPILKGAGESEDESGQLVLAAATIADFGTVILLSLLFSGNAGEVGSRLVFLGSFVTLVAAVGFGVARAGRSKMLSGALGRLGDITAQIRVRGQCCF